MFEIKMRARYMMHGRKSFLRYLNILPKIMLFCSAVCSAVFFSESRLQDEKLWENIPVPEEFICAVSSVSAVCFLFFYFSSSLYSKAKIYYLSDSKNIPPEAFCGFATVCRYIIFRSVLKTVKSLWLFIFYLPFFTVLFILKGAFSVNGMMLQEMFITLIISGLLLFITGTVFGFGVTGRYFLSDMLFLRNPKQKPSEILKTAVSFSKGRLTEIAFYRIRLLFFGTSVFSECVSSLLKEDIFYERKYYKKLGIKNSLMYQSIPRAR